MLQDKHLGSFQYMVDVGVPQEDVAWLRRIANTPGARLTEAAARIRSIQDRAYQGLISASALVQTAACQ